MAVPTAAGLALDKVDNCTITKSLICHVQHLAAGNTYTGVGFPYRFGVALSLWTAHQFDVGPTSKLGVDPVWGLDLGLTSSITHGFCVGII